MFQGHDKSGLAADDRSTIFRSRYLSNLVTSYERCDEKKGTRLDSCTYVSPRKIRKSGFTVSVVF